MHFASNSTGQPLGERGFANPLRVYANRLPISIGSTLRVEPIGAWLAPRCYAAKRGLSTRFEQTRPRPSKLVRGLAAHPRPVSRKSRGDFA
jgi:hypothetical protein